MRGVIMSIVMSLCIFSCITLKSQNYERIELEWDLLEQNINMSNELGEKPNDPDKCFAPCWVIDLPNPNDSQISEYAGTDKNAIGIKKIEVVLQKETTRWIQKIDFINCLSIKPDDCLIWCIVEVPEITAQIYIADTVIQKNFKPFIYRPEVPYKVNQRNEWKEIVCSEDITDQLYEEIRFALKAKGYDMVSDGHFNLITMSLVLEYQKDNNLPIGYLNLDTMNSLGLNN